MHNMQLQEKQMTHHQLRMHTLMFPGNFARIDELSLELCQRLQTFRKHVCEENFHSYFYDICITYIYCLKFSFIFFTLCTRHLPKSMKVIRNHDTNKLCDRSPPNLGTFLHGSGHMKKQLIHVFHVILLQSIFTYFTNIPSSKWRD